MVETFERDLQTSLHELFLCYASHFILYMYWSLIIPTRAGFDTSGGYRNYSKVDIHSVYVLLALSALTIARPSIYRAAIFGGKSDKES